MICHNIHHSAPAFTVKIIQAYETFRVISILSVIRIKKLEFKRDIFSAGLFNEFWHMDPKEGRDQHNVGSFRLSLDKNKHKHESSSDGENTVLRN